MACKLYLLQGMLPAEAQDNERVRMHLNAALNAMNAAVDGVPLHYSQPGGAGPAGAGYSYAGAAGALYFNHKPQTAIMDEPPCKC